MRVIVLHAPRNYRDLLGTVPAGVVFRSRLGTMEQCIHAFFAEQKELQTSIPQLLKALAPDGMLWISWPKQSRKRLVLQKNNSGDVPRHVAGRPYEKTDLVENILRELFLPHGIVDVKVCAVDEHWSALKFVWRREHR